MTRRLLRLLYLLAQHPFHAHRWLVDRGLAQGWVREFAQFWDRVRPPGLPITDYTSYLWLEYYFSAKFRERCRTGDHFDDPDAEFARLLSYVRRRERHPLRCLAQAWHLRRCRTVLEFGAGAAPYAHFVRRAWPRRQKVVGADVPGLIAKYAGSVSPHTSLWSRYDGVVCTEVFEHLSDPVGTAARLRWCAKQTLVFDYVNDGSYRREVTLDEFRTSGRLTGPDARGLYVWRRRTGGEGRAWRRFDRGWWQRRWLGWCRWWRGR